MQILIDMNLTYRWVDCLRNAGYEAVHWSSVGAANTKDVEIFEYARENGYVLLTNDLDFPQILAHTRQAMPSVVLLRSEPLVPEIRGQELIEALEVCRSDLERGAIVSLDWSGKPRARVLPL